MDFRIFPLIFAPFIGSFLGVLVLRLPDGRAIVWERSACQHCGTMLGPRDLVPILSYLLSRGRCRHCGQEIGAFHLWVELAAIAVAGSAALVARDPAWLWVDCLLGWALLTLAWIDARTLLLPDALTLPLLLTGLTVTAWLAPDDLADHAIAALLGYGALALAAAIYERLRGIVGLGMGDAKLLGVAGAWVGLAALPWVLFLGAAAGLAMAGWKWWRHGRVDRYRPVPFGPFLAIATWVMRLTGWTGGI